MKTPQPLPLPEGCPKIDDALRVLQSMLSTHGLRLSADEGDLIVHLEGWGFVVEEGADTALQIRGWSPPEPPADYVRFVIHTANIPEVVAAANEAGAEGWGARVKAFQGLPTPWDVPRAFARGSMGLYRLAGSLASHGVLFRLIPFTPPAPSFHL